jgi:hypothetical protein
VVPVVDGNCGVATAYHTRRTAGAGMGARGSAQGTAQEAVELQRTGAWQGADVLGAGDAAQQYRRTRRLLTEPQHLERPHGRRVLPETGRRPPHFAGEGCKDAAH